MASRGDGRPYVAAVIENPIQYHSPLFRHIARDGRIRLKVLYLTDRGIQPYRYGGVIVQHSPALLEGYEWTILRNRSPFQNSFGLLDNVDLEIWPTIARGAFDAVWFHGYNYASHWLGFAACIRAGVPILLRGESEEFFARPRLRRLVKRRALGWLFRHVAAFLYIGEMNRRFYLDYGVPEERLFYVPYSVDNQWFQGAPGEQAAWRREVRKELGIATDALVFVFASKHRHPKRPLDAIRAFCRLSHWENVVLLVLGDGPLRTEAEGFYHRHGGGRRAVFLGFRPYEDLRRYFAASDVLVFPSVENWGMALNEALAAGLALVSSDQVVGWFDMVRPGFNGFVYRAGSIEGLAAHLQTLVDKPELVAAMKRASVERARVLSFETATDGLVSATNRVRHG